MLMQDVCQDASPLAMHRARDCLQQLAALACFVSATKFSLYCRECNKLLDLYVRKDLHRTTLAPLLLRAAVRASQSLGRPLSCLIDNADLNELRQARGASVADQAAPLRSTTWGVLRLKALLLKQLMRVHYTLEDSNNNFPHCSVAMQENSFPNLNRVAALCLGDVLLKRVKDAAKNQQMCLQILRLELCCRAENEGRASESFSALKKLFLQSSILQSLRGLRSEMRALMQQAEKKGGMNLERSLWALYKVNACCTVLNSHQAQELEKISTSAQQLVMHLRCWEGKNCDANVLLCLCVLALERQLDMAIAIRQDRRPCERPDRRLQRKVQHFMRTHRRRYRTAYAVPVSIARALVYRELQGIHKDLRQSLALYKKAEIVLPVEDVFFHSLIRFKAISLYMGEMALYELLWNLRELVVLAIERKLLLTRNLVALLPRLSAYCLRSFQLGRAALGYDTRLINTLSEELRAQRQVLLSKMVLRDSKINLPAGQEQGRKRDQHSITTTQLPSFLAKNIRDLITDPVAIYACQSTKEFADLSRVVILELTLLARGARALQVDRVAALSEVLLEVYRSLNALSVLPGKNVLKRNLQCAHRCLRLALNQAAARQKVCDVRPTIVSLYHFLECLHRAPEHSLDSLQTALRAVNSLTADMRAFADVFARDFDKVRGRRFSLARDQLQGLMATTRRLQEDLTATGMINIARWGPPLMLAVGRYSNERGKPARLELFLEEIEAARGLVEQLHSPLQTLLCLMIERSVEGIAQRRASGKPDCARLSLRAKRSAAVLTVTLEDDGTGLSVCDIASVTEEIGMLGGALTLENESANGRLVSVTIPCASVRWDIASKSL